jgi:hypothetical protein
VNRRRWPLGTIGVLAVLVTAGAAARSATQAAPGTPMPHSARMPHGMPMHAGMRMPAASPAAGVPSVSARMICGPEIRRDVAMIMGLPSPPAATSSWTGHLYTCAYQLRGGRLVLSVQDAPDVTAARAYFRTLARRLRPVSALTGLPALGLPAFRSTAGAVVFLKDDKTLEVDAAGLPARAGPDHQAREALAYAIAADVLACWTGK